MTRSFLSGWATYVVAIGLMVRMSCSTFQTLSHYVGKWPVYVFQREENIQRLQQQAQALKTSLMKSGISFLLEKHQRGRKNVPPF